MPTITYEIDEMRRRPLRSMPKAAFPARARIGSGVALASPGGSGHWKDNPYHWQTLILLMPLFHNPDSYGHRKPISPFLIERTVDEMRNLFSGFTLSRAKGWYWDEANRVGVSDELVRFEVDGVFTGNDLYLLHTWKKKLQRRFRQDYIYIRLVPSSVAV
jgi:hypothetical protein